MPPLTPLFLLLSIPILFPSNDAQLHPNSTQLNQKLESTKVRNRRSNFPCGQSFVPCAQDEEKNEVEEHSINAHDKEIIKKLLDSKSLQFLAARAKADVDKLYNETEQKAFEDFRETSFLFSTRAWTDLMGTDRYAKDMAYSALIASGATAKTKEKGMSAAEASTLLPAMPVNDTVIKRICPLNVIAECIPGKYRTYSGHCNNVDGPLRGATYEPMQRLLRADYDDGVSQPRLSLNATQLSSPRQISRQLFSTPHKQHQYCTLMLAQWAQFVYADLVHVGSTRLFKGNESLPLPCCAIDHPECMPILTDEDDQTYKARGQCLSYARSFIAPREQCNLGTREQANMQTSFLDASHLYGSRVDEARQLRSLTGGRLRAGAENFNRRELLPPRKDAKEVCASKLGGRPCFESASRWTNLLPTNAALHTLWLRQHNTVARLLQKRNSHWDDERLYQEARRIVIAQIQHITYNEFLPTLLGKEQVASRGLRLRKRSFDSGYDMKTNPSVLNEYASAVGLFFFSLLPDTISQTTQEGQQTGSKPMGQLFNDPSMLYIQEKIEQILRFLTHTPIQQPGLQMSEELKERFLKGNDQYGLDLAALIIQIGRDHGLPGYLKWREFCSLSVPQNFTDLQSLLWEQVDTERIRTQYESVEDMDLFVLGLAEKPERGALIGPTFSCILAHQFERVRHGDRFWYENFFQPSAFTESQLMELRKTTLAQILCDNTDNFGPVQPSLFELPNKYGNCPIRCNTSTIARPDFDQWIDQEPKRRLPITQETLEKALRTGAEQFRRLQEAERRRQTTLSSSSPRDRSSAFLAHANLMAPKKESLDRAQAAGILRETTKVLLRGTGLDSSEKLPNDLDISTLQQLLPQVDVSRVIGNFSDYLESRPNADKECLPKPMPCDHTSKYRYHLEPESGFKRTPSYSLRPDSKSIPSKKFRSASGWCNNLRFPAYGNAFEPLRRLADPVYDDGFDTPRTKATNGQLLPSARKVSVALHNDNEKEDSYFSHMLMQMGQIIDHDFTHSPLARGPGNAVLNCSRCDSHNSLSIHCFPIKIDQNDPHYPAQHSNGEPRCMPFARSLLGQVTLGYRNQLNQLTSFLDASHVYGSTACEANSLRLFMGGKLNFTDLGFNKEALPQGGQERDCRTRSQFPCFNAGDERNNIQPGLATIHTLMMREHNRIATQLHTLNAHWTDERLYQEARRIMTAKFQHIVYSEWLPIVLGCETMARYDLTPRQSGYYNGYDATCDAAVSQEFAVAAFRFGHTLIRNVFPRMDANYDNKTYGEGINLKENFNNATALYAPNIGHMESILMGLLGAPAMVYDRHISNAVRNHLFQKLGGPFTGLDLIAVNIQRARDHGVPGYNAYRQMCGLPKAHKFDDLLTTMERDAVEAFRKVYSNVDDIDLFSGMMSEKPLDGALVGPMIACVVGEQFQRAKRCDRFYYENEDPNVRFTPGQLMEIRKSSFSKMLCQNSEMAQRIQPNAFLLPNDLTNAPIHCEEMLDTDLDEWIDRQFCLVDQRVIHLSETKRVSPCISCTCTMDGTECHSMSIESCDDLLINYSLDEIKKDTVCMIQCSRALQKLIPQKA